MAYEMKENSGSLFRNEKRETENHPVMRGSALIGGVEYWVSAWTKLKGDGEKWVSLAFTPKEVVKPVTLTDKGGGTLELDDEIPW